MFFYVWLVMEPIRLIVGHVGNLGERVAWLAPFWILTLFPQLVTQVYFLMSTLITGWVTLPIEYVRPHAHNVLAPLPPPPAPLVLTHQARWCRPSRALSTPRCFM
jgi:hypothetical protein